LVIVTTVESSVWAKENCRRWRQFVGFSFCAVVKNKIVEFFIYAILKVIIQL